MAGANVFIKYSMFIFNLVFWLCGVLILGVAIWFRTGTGQQVASSEGLNTPVNILITGGAIMMILGFLGCWGAIKENRCMLLCFFIGLLLIMVMQVTSGILQASARSQVDHTLNETLHENAKLLSQTNENAKEFHKIMIDFQQEKKCCGMNGADDWGDNFEQVAYASCKCSSPPDSCVSYEGKHVHKKPCSPLIKAILSKRGGTIIGVSFGVAFLEILGLVFSMILYRQIGRK